MLKSIKLQKISLKNINAVRNEALDSTDISVNLERQISEDSENRIVLICKLDIGNDDQPFTIHVESEASFKKLKPISGNQIIEKFTEISYPILSEISLLIAQVVSAMNYPALVISPQEFLGILEEEGKEDVE